MLPFVLTTQTRPSNFESMRSSTVYNPAPYEVLGANMPETAGILPLTIRVGNPLSSHKLNKIESTRPNSDYVYFHLEKYCALVGLWYPQWLQLSIYCEMFREILLAVFKASIERPERTNFLLTLARYLALKDDAPQAAGNPMSTRYHWRGPMHTAIWAEYSGKKYRGPNTVRYTPSLPDVRVWTLVNFRLQCWPIFQAMRRLPLSLHPPLAHLPRLPGDETENLIAMMWAKPKQKYPSMLTATPTVSTPLQQSCSRRQRN